MKRFMTILKHLSLVVFILSSLNAFATQPKTVCVQLKFNGAGLDVTKDVNYSEGITALEALMYVSKVQTHPAGDYVFVDKINDIANEKGNNAWYFTVNDVLSDKLAINRELKAGDTVKWIYKQDVCSKTINATTSATHIQKP